MYGAETWAVKKAQEKLDVAEMRMLGWMSGAESLDREVSLPPRHFGFRTSGAPSRWGGGGLLRTFTIDGESVRELVNVLSWIHDGRLFIVSDTYVGNFQTTILAS